jgi:hypothetical protein
MVDVSVGFKFRRNYEFSYYFKDVIKVTFHFSFTFPLKFQYLGI